MFNDCLGGVAPAILIIWLQGIWLPQHGYSFEETPLWAGIYMLPMTAGFLISAPLSGFLSDRRGARFLTTGGMLLTGLTFYALTVLPVDFDYRLFALLLLANGIGMGMFSSPNRAEMMNSLPRHARGAGSGMTATFQNSAMVLSIGIFFSLMIVGLTSGLPSVMQAGLVAHGVPDTDAAHVAQLPAVAVLFAAFLGYNPVQQLLGPAPSRRRLVPRRRRSIRCSLRKLRSCGFPATRRATSPAAASSPA